MTKIAGSGSESGSISQKHGSADPDLDPPQNVMDPVHCQQTQFINNTPCICTLQAMDPERSQCWLVEGAPPVSIQQVVKGNTLCT
jgi:hypothetical protein